MLIDTITNINLNRMPERLCAAMHEEVVIDFNHSQAFLFGGNMGRFKRTVDLPPLCACGCGERVKWNKDKKNWNIYVPYHHLRGKRRVFTKEHCEKISIAQKKSSFFHIYNKTEAHSKDSSESNKRRKLSKETREKISNAIKELGKNHPFRTEKYRRDQAKRMHEAGDSHPSKDPKFREMHSKRMKNGGAAYANFFIKNPSGPQIQLFNKVKKIYPQAILNYPSLNFSIDIAIPDLMIAIEYDCWYWHDEEKDKIRQSKLEGKGWKFLRYKDYIPKIDELKKDLKK